MKVVGEEFEVDDLLIECGGGMGVGLGGGEFVEDGLEHVFAKVGVGLFAPGHGVGVKSEVVFALLA